ncbi:MAG: hypothetical protein QF389_10020 [Planctomycetota bacterium]|nr:hypothetical protein [Planctomycetota bacterium]
MYQNTTNPNGNDPERASVSTALSLKSTLFILFIALGIFVGLNPIWEEQSIGHWEENILYSYYTIPILVFALLWLEKKLSLAGCLLESLKLGLLKFVITFAISHTIWVGVGFPKPYQYPANRLLPKERRVAPTDSPIELEATRDIQGKVTNADGVPLSNVLVRIAGGLEEFEFAAPSQAVVIENSGKGFTPSLSIVRAFQPILLRSTDSGLHTASFTTAEGRLLRNVPLVPTKEKTIVFELCHDIVTLKCTVHGDKEVSAHLAVMCTPFGALTDANGNFSFTKVPKGKITIAALRTNTKERATAIEIDSEDDTEIRIVLP